MKTNMKSTLCSYGYTIHSYYKDFGTIFRSYRGLDAVNHFINSLKGDYKMIRERLQRYKTKMLIKPSQRIEHEFATKCHICGKQFEDKKGLKKVKDHDHYTGKYISAAHSSCNVNRNFKNWRLPVIMHNFRGYDSHLIMKGLSDYIKSVSAIPNNMEN